MKDKGVVIESVKPESPADRAGIAKGDSVLSINGNPVSDGIDFMFYASEPPLILETRRDSGKIRSVKLALKEAETSGIELEAFRIRTCRNNCIFCFVKQLPKGLRKTLYVKDEDYRMSFLYGNYITMTNLTKDDKKRIVRQGLSPLYISVHSTNPGIRNKMLGNPHAPDIMKELQFLKENKIKFHVQIVLCPKINDGAELKKTIAGLCTLYPYLQSIAVVPVGLTAHRKTKVRPVEKEDAQAALRIITDCQRRFKKKYGDPIVYASDELYIKAGEPFPQLADYGGLPQLENGVGMAALFNSRAKAVKPQKAVEGHPQILSRKYLTFTGVSFYPYLKKFIEKLSKTGIDISLVPVENAFFGKSITVAGLITGRDVILTLGEKTHDRNVLLIPDVNLREGGDVFLDDVSVKEVAEALGIKARVIGSDPEGIIKGLI